MSTTTPFYYRESKNLQRQYRILLHERNFGGEFLCTNLHFKENKDNRMLRSFEFKIVSNPFIQILWLCLKVVMTHILGIPMKKGAFVHAT